MHAQHTQPMIQERTLPVNRKVPKKRILVVDEDEPLRILLGLLLENEGYAVATCGEESTAVDLIETSSFDLIISGHSRPGVDGLRILETVRRRESPVPVLLMASQFEMGPYIEAMNLGALDYLPKPLDYAEVQRIVTTHC
jgi:DNA-binding response OmpR family regulator